MNLPNISGIRVCNKSIIWLVLCVLVSVGCEAQKFKVFAGTNYTGFFQDKSVDDHSSNKGLFGYNVGIGFDLNTIKNNDKVLPLRFSIQIQNNKSKSEESFTSHFNSTDYHYNINRTVLAVNFYFFNINIKKWPEIGLGLQYSRLLIDKSTFRTERFYPSYELTEQKGGSPKNYGGISGRLAYTITIKKFHLIPQYEAYLGFSSGYMNSYIQHSLSVGVPLN